MRRTCLLFALVVLTWSLLGTSVVEACPTCKEALAGQAKYGNLPQAYMWSILFMMSMPFLLLGTFGTYMYLQVRRARLNPSKSGGPTLAPAAMSVVESTAVEPVSAESPIERELVHAE